ncbi:MAG: hypothetical protein JST42_16335 [Bacteroidetes bacterium]|nr:hypothetical protein [Bacteroidota bacterium]
MTDKAGNVYIAVGEVYRYDPQGRQSQLIRTPERLPGSRSAEIKRRYMLRDTVGSIK